MVVFWTDDRSKVVFFTGLTLSFHSFLFSRLQLRRGREREREREKERDRERDREREIERER